MAGNISRKTIVCKIKVSQGTVVRNISGSLPDILFPGNKRIAMFGGNFRGISPTKFTPDTQTSANEGIANMSERFPDIIPGEFRKVRS